MPSRHGKQAGVGVTYGDGRDRRMSSLLRGRWSRRLLGNSIMFPVVGEELTGSLLDESIGGGRPRGPSRRIPYAHKSDVEEIGSERDARFVENEICGEGNVNFWEEE